MERGLHSKKMRVWLWVGIIFATAVLVTGGWWFMRQTGTYSQVREQLLAKSLPFQPLYFKAVPEGFMVIGGSVETHENVVMFGLSKAENRITITQQARPELMEEVNKVQDVSVPAGKAYVAKINERTVGFLLTDTTLVIVSAIQPLDADTITAILSHLVKL